MNGSIGNRALQLVWRGITCNLLGWHCCCRRELSSRLRMLILSMLLFIVSRTHAQYVPFYPLEIYFNPFGYTNSIPGTAATEYTSFSSVKLLLDKDLPSFQKMVNTISFFGTVERYHSITKARDYFPLSLNPKLKTFLFIHSLVTPGLELNGNYEFLPALDGNGDIFNHKNYRLRIRPFLYLFVTPNLFINNIVTIGFSRYSDKSGIATGYKNVPALNADGSLQLDSHGNPVQTLQQKFTPIKKDYSIYKYEGEAIYITPFHVRFFVVPYVYFNLYDELPARSSDGAFNGDNPPLRERGIGSAFGLRYRTFRWGYAEGAIELERNIDEIFDYNSYVKLQGNVKWENQYFTDWFGFMLMADITRHFSTHTIQVFPEESETYGELGALEIRGDVMFIFNLNRNISIRPEYDLIYKELSNYQTFKKSRFWMHLHIFY